MRRTRNVPLRMVKRGFSAEKSLWSCIIAIPEKVPSIKSPTGAHRVSVIVMESAVKE